MRRKVFPRACAVLLALLAAFFASIPQVGPCKIQARRHDPAAEPDEFCRRECDTHCRRHRTNALLYQWSFNGTNLANGTHHGGATAASLTVSNLTFADAGSYLVVVTNVAAP